MIRVSYVTCTRNRKAELLATIAQLERLHAQDPGQAELVVADNASDEPVASWLPATELPVRVVRLDRNMAAAGRNAAAERARHDWLVMLDDDSAPKDLGHLRVLAGVDASVAAVMADITLPDGSRERGGLPEVFVGCGAAVRKDAFLQVGGYDPAIFFAAEEPDLCARLIAAGWWVAFSPWFRVLHHKTPTNRDLNRMLRLLTRNQGLIVERTTPPQERRLLRRDHLRRCAWIARKEGAMEGFAQGLAELRRLRRTVRPRPLSRPHFERFTGLLYARQAVQQAIDGGRMASACLIHEGKHAWAVRRALLEAGVRLVDDPEQADRLAIATMSPGPMLDALVQLHAQGLGDRALAPWTPAAAYAGLQGEPFPLMPELVSDRPEPAAPAEAPAPARIRA
ncbi:MAG: hypothetical protein KatS3mg103_1000 [Phycisphaerales bacterium]|nr:MAG: hypothetical protein KatS3mg103_1000 [Phycisphaerales bacterium]